MVVIVAVSGSGAVPQVFFLVYSLLACDLSDHGEIIYSPFPVRCPRNGGPLQGPLCPPPRPLPGVCEGAVAEVAAVMVVRVHRFYL